MIEEYMKINDRSFTISVNASEINEVREKNIERNSVQIFKDGKVYSANSVGNEDLESVKNRALENEVGSINYDYEYQATKQINANSGKNLNNAELMNIASEFTNKVQTELPNFLLSGKIESLQSSKSIKNNQGGDYSDVQNQLGGFFVLKQKGSPNIMDSILPFEGKGGSFDVPEFSQFLEMHKNFDNVVEVEKGRYPVVFLMNEAFYSKVAESCHPDIYHQNAGLYSGKLGQKLFNERINFSDIRHNVDFNTFHQFDDEGTKLDLKLPLIENGIFKNVFYDQKSAKKYGAQSTGNGRREFNSNITPRTFALRFESTGETLNQIYQKHEKVIVAVLAGGGDTTSNGTFSSPMQVGFVVENGKILGRANQVSLTNHIEKMMGDDFIAVLNHNIVPVSQKPFVSYMDIF